MAVLFKLVIALAAAEHAATSGSRRLHNVQPCVNVDNSTGILEEMRLASRYGQSSLTLCVRASSTGCDKLGHFVMSGSANLPVRIDTATLRSVVYAKLLVEISVLRKPVARRPDNCVPLDTLAAAWVQCVCRRSALSHAARHGVLARHLSIRLSLSASQRALAGCCFPVTQQPASRVGGLCRSRSPLSHCASQPGSR
jgi:hypothetical protein